MPLLRTLLVVLPFAGLACLTHAQTPAGSPAYPQKAIRVVVPYTPGGGTDLMARVISAELALSLGQPVVVENKPGAAATIGTDAVAKAAPDGYTLGLVSSGHTMNPWIYRKLPFDTLQAFAPVIQIATGSNVVVVSSQVPAKTLAEAAQRVRASPGVYSFGSAGIGSPTHLAGEMFAKSAGGTMIHVPYKGSSQAEAALAGGEITMLVDSIPAALPFITAGKTRALAVTGSERFPLLPDVPTSAQAGMVDFTPITWWGMVAPAGTPPEIVGKLNRAIADVLQKPDVREQFLRFGATPLVTSPAQFQTFIAQEMERNRKLIAALGIDPL